MYLSQAENTGWNFLSPRPVPVCLDYQNPLAIVLAGWAITTGFRVDSLEHSEGTMAPRSLFFHFVYGMERFVDRLPWRCIRRGPLRSRRPIPRPGSRSPISPSRSNTITCSF